MRTMRRLRFADGGFWLAVVIAAAAVTAAIALSSFRAPVPSPPTAPPPGGDARIAQGETAAAPASAPKNSDRVPAAESPADPTLRLGPPYRALDARSFSSDERVVTLDQVSGPRRDDICFDRDRRLIACGLAARAALTNALGKGWVLCRAARLTEDGVAAQCATPGGDLAERLTREGWIRPLEGADPALVAAANEAREQQRGLWNGGWRVR